MSNPDPTWISDKIARWPPQLVSWKGSTYRPGAGDVTGVAWCKVKCQDICSSLSSNHNLQCDIHTWCSPWYSHPASISTSSSFCSLWVVHRRWISCSFLLAPDERWDLSGFYVMYWAGSLPTGNHSRVPCPTCSSQLLKHSTGQFLFCSSSAVQCDLSWVDFFLNIKQTWWYSTVAKSSPSVFNCFEAAMVFFRASAPTCSVLAEK